MNQNDAFEDKLIKYQQLESFNPDIITKMKKLQLVAKFADLKESQPNLTQKQICSKLNTSETSIRRIRQDLNMKTPYKYDISSRSNKSNKSKPINQSLENNFSKSLLNSNNSKVVISKNEKQLHSCSVCNKTCGSKSGLISHMKTHNSKNEEYGGFTNSIPRLRIVNNDSLLSSNINEIDPEKLND